MGSKFRLDDLLVSKGLADSKSRAKALILAGKVRLGTEVLDKAGKTYAADTPLTLEQPPRYVSRGGEKLEAALDAFEIRPEGWTILDIGASTGGFTDCLLQRGAAAAVCVDVGRAQMHGKLLSDPRVTNIEQLNARHLKAEQLPRSTFPLVVMDLSFISLALVLEPAWSCLQDDGTLIALIKPQFEAEKAEVDRGRGVIRDDRVRERCLKRILEFARLRLPDSSHLGTIDSPIAGGDGNREYLAAWRRVPEGPG